MALLQPGDLFPNGTASIEFTSGSGTTITPFSQSGNAYVFFETDLINNPNEPTKSLSGATFTSLTASRGAVVDGTGYRAGIVTSPGSSFTFTPSVDIPAGRVLLKATGNIGLDVASFIGLLNLYPGSAAAYSLRWLNTSYTGSAVEVSRDVDTQVQDIGFTANGSLDSTALLEFATNSSQSLLDYATGSAAAYSLRKVTSDSPVTTLPANFGSGAAAAYSLRKVNANYTDSAIEVRRSSDDTTQDIGFDSNGDLDTTTLLAFVGGENRFEDSDPSSGDFATLLNGSTSTNDWGLSSPSFTNKTILDRDLGNALAYPSFDEVETGETYTISAYVKIVDGNSATFGNSAGQQGYFNLRGTAAGSPSDYTVTNVTGNIYRISATIVAGSSSGTGFLRYTNANAGKIEITGFQIVKGSTLTDYVETSGDISGFGYVRTWYDQSGNNNDASNGTDTEQPLIVDGGTLVTENSKAAIDFDGTDDYFTGAAKTTMNDTAIFAVIKSDSNTQDAVFIQNFLDTNNLVSLGLGGIGTANAIGSRLRVGGSNVDSVGDSTFTATDQTLVSYLADNAAGQMFIDGTEETDAVDSRNGGSNTTIGARGDGNYTFNGKFQEVIFFDSDQSGNRTDIEWEINNYYNIYSQWDRQSAIEVRRSSDDTTQDIGFDSNGNLDTTALTTFVNADVGTYTSDFSSTEDLSEALGTGSAAQSVGGVDDAYKFTLSGGSGLHQTLIGAGLSGGGTATLSLDYYIPSSNTVVDGLLFGMISGTTQSETTTDAWTSVSLSVTDFGNGNAFFRAKDGGSTTIDADGDVFYLKNIVITQTTADGHVRTWYDQSGNHVTASNGTDTEQPLIVDGGTLVEKNGKTAIDFDGVDDKFTVSNVSVRSFYTVLSSVDGGDFMSTTQNRVVFNASTFDWQEKNFSTSVSYTLGNQALLTFNDTSSGIFSLNGVTHTNTDANPYSQGSEVFNRIGANDAGSPLIEGTIQEFILYDSDQSSNRLGIESNINAYYDIYTNPSASAYVRTWYDQSGNTNDAIQTAESQRPKIVNTGSLVLENGKLAIDFDGVDDNLQNASLITNTTHTIVAAFVDVDTRTFRYFYDGGASVAQMMLGTAGNEDQYRYSSGGTGNFSTLSGTFADPIDILSFAVHGTTSQIAINGSLNLSGESKANPTAGKFNIGESAANSLNAAVKFWEIIVFASDQSGNRTGIEAQINSFYKIYS